MAYTNQTWPAIIGLDLGKHAYSGCRLSGEGYEKRHNFTGKMTRGTTAMPVSLRRSAMGIL